MYQIFYITLYKATHQVPKLTQSELSKKYGIGTTTVSDILKRREFYRTQFRGMGGKKRKRFNSGWKYSSLNDALFKWFEQARSKNLPINGPILQEKALEFARQLDFLDFKASTGWLASFKSPFNIGHFKISGESADVNILEIEK